MKKQVSIIFFIIIFILLNVPAYSQSNAIVRQQLDAQYEKLAEAYERRDSKGISELKTSDFHAVFIDNKVGDAKTMREYSRQFLNLNQSPLSIKFNIEKLDVSENGLAAVADTSQQVVRYQELSGKLRKVETSVLQRGTWIKTRGGWKLKLIDNLRDRKRFVDGKRVDPTKPYNPDAEQYIPTGLGTLKVHDKNSPVWQELEAQYQQAAEAYINKDLETTLKLRKLLTIETPDGRLHPSDEVAESTKAQFNLNQNILKISNKILSLTTDNEKAVVFVQQEFSRMQNLAGKLRRVDSSINQTEVFVKTPEGWRVVHIKIPGTQIRYVDGKRVDPTKPYNPDDPPYNPDDAGVKKQ